MDPFASALDQAAAMRRGEVSPAELLDMYAGRVRDLDPGLNEFVLMTEELAREQAAAAVRRLRAGEGGPLCGVPVSVKELAFLAGHRCTFGSRAFEEFVAPWDDYPVARLKAEGCVILGKTNAPEF
ncbi:MAG: amidase family protein, partial [Candidatus Dormibacterales bacterium]